VTFVIAGRGDAVLVNILYEYTVLETLSVVVVTVHTTVFNFKQHEMSYLLLIYVFFLFITNSVRFCERHESVDLCKMLLVYLEAVTYSKYSFELGGQLVRSVSVDSSDVFI
jgi:hypothetical protein